MVWKSEDMVLKSEENTYFSGIICRCAKKALPLHVISAKVLILFHLYMHLYMVRIIQVQFGVIKMQLELLEAVGVVKVISWSY